MKTAIRYLRVKLGPIELGTAVMYSREEEFKEGTLSTVVEVHRRLGRNVANGIYRIFCI